MLPTCFHESCSRQSPPVTALWSSQAEIIDLLDWEEMIWKAFVTGGLSEPHKYAGPTVPQALHQATSRDNFPKGWFLLQGRSQWGFTPEQQEEGLWVLSCSSMVLRATTAHHSEPQMCTLCLLIHTRQDQWGSYGDLLASISWNDRWLSSNCLLSHYCWKIAVRLQGITGGNWNWSKCKGTTFVAVWNSSHHTAPERGL